jgi:hypothetical protein
MKINETILNKLIKSKATEILIYFEELVEKEISNNAFDPDRVIELANLRKTLPSKIDNFLEMDIDELVKSYKKHGIIINYKTLRQLIDYDNLIMEE